VLLATHDIPVPRDICVFSIDVEDWYHIMDLPATPRIGQWQALPSLVDRNFRNLLDIVDARGVKTTCFFLGWVAERHPSLVREASARGHEVASHGYAHDLVYEMSPEDFLADIRRAKDVLEQLTGAAVPGYRAPGFSVTSETPWFFDKVTEAGYRYSSSIFPGSRQHGGLMGFRLEPVVVETTSGHIYEVPASMARFFGKRRCFFGGGYLRLFPYPLVQRMARQVLAEGRPVVFYIHPREIDPVHPRLTMSFVRRFKSYVGLHSTAAKLDRLLGHFNFMSFAKLLEASLDPARAPRACGRP